MKKINLLIFILVVIIAALVLKIVLQETPPVEPTNQATLQAPPSEPIKQPIVHYPVPEIPPQPPEEKDVVNNTVAEPSLPLPKTLPTVGNSDESMQDALSRLQLDASLFKLILQGNLIQRLVATIDTLPEKRLPRAHLPIVPPKGRFITSGTEEAPQTSPRNNVRYQTYVQLLEALNQELVLKIYVHFYALFQEAYEQLGYRNAYFNDRLVNVIDHLLSTPNPEEPLLLAQPAVLYVYADPLLERLSSGQKILLRIGAENRQRVLKVLREYRQQLVNLHP